MEFVRKFLEGSGICRGFIVFGKNRFGWEEVVLRILVFREVFLYAVLDMKRLVRIFRVERI